MFLLFSSLLAFYHLPLYSTEKLKCEEISKHDALLIVDVQNCFMEKVLLPVDKSPEYPIPPQYLENTPQGTFLKGGSLGVSKSSQIIDIIHLWIHLFNSKSASIFLSADWHPENHCSFCRNGTKQSNPDGYLPQGGICGPLGKKSDVDLSDRCIDVNSIQDYNRGSLMQWPDHCVQGTFGARFHPFLRVPKNATVLKKGFLRQYDSYSTTASVLSPSWPEWDDNESAEVLAEQPAFSVLLAKKDIRRLFVVGLATDYCVRLSSLDAAAQRFGDVIMVHSASRAVSEEGCSSSITELVKSGVKVSKDSSVSPYEVLSEICSSPSSSSFFQQEEKRIYNIHYLQDCLYCHVLLTIGFLMILAIFVKTFFFTNSSGKKYQ